MRIAVDLDSGAVTTWEGQALTAPLTAKRRDRFPVHVRYVRSGVVVERPSGATGQLGLKTAGVFTGGYAAYAASWTVGGYGTTRTYTFDLNLNTTALNALFANDPATISLNAEVVCTDLEGIRSSASFLITVANDVVRGDEAAPETNTDLKATQAQAETGTDNNTWMTPLRTAQAITARSVTIASKATQAQAETGTDNNAWMTPLRTAQAMAGRINSQVLMLSTNGTVWALTVDNNGIVTTTPQP